jgi:hypothetical protein
LVIGIGALAVAAGRLAGADLRAALIASRPLALDLRVTMMRSF